MTVKVKYNFLKKEFRHLETINSVDVICRNGKTINYQIQHEDTKLRVAVHSFVSSCKFCITQCLIHIFVHLRNGPLYEVTSPGDRHEVISAVL